ncbi:MAG TPA: hypothetical protein GXX75_16580 [Clostridiales bacterium]|nr:hypothetical protein [Clostridiales bacterium]
MEKYNSKNDLVFQKPYIDIDEWRETSVNYQYIHGGFEGTDLKFSFFFPEKQSYTGRFFQFMPPVQGSENASIERRGEEDKIAFAITHGAYFVESNMGVPTAFGPLADPTIIYRASAAAAEYSREIAIKLYGGYRPFGYIYGGSGGGYKTMSCVENTDTWDGAVPYIIGSPISIPNMFSVRAHAKRVLRHKLPLIADYIEPGSAVDLKKELNGEELSAFEEVTKMGFPPRVWFQYKTIDDGALPVLQPLVDVLDAQYYEDFWTLPGYLGAEENGSARRDRIQHRAKVTNVFIPNEKNDEDIKYKSGADDAWTAGKTVINTENRPFIEIDTPLTGDLYLASTTIEFMTGEIAGYKVPLEKLIDGTRITIADGFGINDMLGQLAKVKMGDEIMIDNSRYIAIQTYHRHQLPDETYIGFDQFRNGDGTPKYPQRAMLVGPIISHGGAGSIQSGDFNCKMIVVATLMDESAFPWQPDWYRSLIKTHLGDKIDDRFRLWYFDHALHDDQSKTVDELHLISYLGGLHQALLDLSDWVERGIAPSKTTEYSIRDGQLSVPEKANDRHGIQPTVVLTANGKDHVEASVNEGIEFIAEIELPEGTGKIVKAEFSFEGEENYPVPCELSNIRDNGEKATCKINFSYQAPGTYFAVVRVYANRNGDKEDIFTQVKNICRVRIIVK